MAASEAIAEDVETSVTNSFSPGYSNLDEQLSTISKNSVVPISWKILGSVPLSVSKQQIFTWETCLIQIVGYHGYWTMGRNRIYKSWGANTEIFWIYPDWKGLCGTLHFLLKNYIKSKVLHSSKHTVHNLQHKQFSCLHATNLVSLNKISITLCMTRLTDHCFH